MSRKRRTVEVVVLDDSGEDDRAARGNGLQLAPSRPAAPKPRDDDGVGGDSGAAPAVDTRRLWVDKHTPTTSEQLAVAPKKVAEVRGWLQFACAPHSVNRALLLTGPPGCGKSATMRALAADNGLEVCEWVAPTPTSWEDHLYHNHTGLPYESKMDAFEAFITRVIKFRSLPLLPSRPTVPLPATSATTEPLSPTHATPDASQGVSQAPTEFDENDLPNDVYEQMMLDLERRDSGNSAGNSVPSAPTRLVLLDDLPYAHDKSQRARLAAAVQSLVRHSRGPCVLIATTHSEGGKERSGLDPAVAEVAEAVSAGGGGHVTFNPITTAAMKKALRRVAEAEGAADRVATSTLDALAADARGDLRHALLGLQMQCVGLCSAVAARAAAAAAARERERELDGEQQGDSRSGEQQGKGKQPAAKKAKVGKKATRAAKVGKAAACGTGRDLTMGTFHTLGKLLYNKRLPDLQAGAGAHGSSSGGSSRAAGVSVRVREELRRAPLKDDPEAMLAASPLDAGGLVLFLHENVLAFVHHDAVDNMCTVLDYLSDAHLMLAPPRAGGLASRSTLSAAMEDAEAASSMGVGLQPAAAASVAARGVLFANSKLEPSTWQPLRMSQSVAAHNATVACRAAIQDAARQASGGDVGCGRVAAATELLPYMRCMGHAWASAPLRWADADQHAWRGAQRRPALHTAVGAAPTELRRGLLCAEVMAGGCEAAGMVQHGGGAPASSAESEEDHIEDD